MPLTLAAISYHPIVHLHIGPVSISPHGVGIAVGFLLGARLMLPASRAKGIADEDVYALLQRAAIGAIVGARLAYFVNHLGDYSSPLDVLKVWQGGISLLGGFSGAILLALPAMRSRRLSFWRVMDAAVINPVTAQAACEPLATNSRARKRTPKIELTMLYSASPKAPTMQIWPNEAISRWSVVIG